MIARYVIRGKQLVNNRVIRAGRMWDTNICYEREINKGTVHICQVYFSYKRFDKNLSNYHKLIFFSQFFVDNFQNILITLN